MNTLINDTKAYITLTNPTYTKCENTLEISASGLITKWAKVEVLESGAAKIVNTFNASKGVASNDQINVLGIVLYAGTQRRCGIRKLRDFR